MPPSTETINCKIEATPKRVGLIKYFGYIVLAGLAFCCFHLAVSPASAYVDSTHFGIGRGPLFEELFKFVFAFFALRHFGIKEQAIIIGIAIGVSETVINSLMVFDEMYADISSTIDGIDETEIWLAIFVGIGIKLVFSVFAHGAIFFAGLKLANGNYVRGFFIAVALHFFANLLLTGI